MWRLRSDRPTSPARTEQPSNQGTMKMNTPRTLLCVATVIALLGAAGAPAADIAPKAREILSRAQNSLITVSALSKLDMGGSGLPVRLGALGEAQEASCGGLVIDASGLTVVSYSALNPMERLAGAIKDQGRRGRRRAEDQDRTLADPDAAGRRNGGSRAARLEGQGARPGFHRSRSEGRGQGPAVHAR